ncbi:hypothetical protein QYF36_006206 [Acer negundo]|nr:hypothetical protein QYF36_006206 [Acer negundo]
MAAPAVKGAAVTALRSVLLRVRHAAEQSGCRPEQIRVVGVSKTKPVSLIRQVYDDVGLMQLREDIKWHFIGHLQSNKVKTLMGGVPNLDMVEGVDNVKNANDLDLAVSNLGRNPLKILVQMNTNGEESNQALNHQIVWGLWNMLNCGVQIWHKALKDLKAEIFKRFLNLQELSTGYEIVGVHRNPEHRMDFMDWAPGACYRALVGDFNGWSPTENCVREGHFGHDDYGYWFISLEDKLREGEKPDELYFQQYNYVDDYDKGDSGVTIEEIFKKANDEYWEPEENEMVKNRFELPAKLYEELFGPNGPQTIEELGEIPDAETRYKAWKE